MPTAAELKRGQVVQFDDAPCRIVDLQSHSPSARGASTRVKTKYRNLITGQVLEKNLKGDDRVDDADFDIHYHLQRAILPPPGDDAALQDTVSLLASTQLDMTRPLWQLHLASTVRRCIHALV